MALNSGILVPPQPVIKNNGNTIDDLTVNNALEYDSGNKTLQWDGLLVKDTVINGDAGAHDVTFVNQGVITFNPYKQNLRGVNANLIFDIRANSSNQTNIIEARDTSLGSGQVAMFRINKGSGTLRAQLQCQTTDGKVGVEYLTNNGQRLVQGATNTYNFTAFSTNIRGIGAKYSYLQLQADNADDTNEQYLAFSRNLQELTMQYFSPGAIYTRWNSQGTWIYTNRLAPPPHSFENSFEFYAENAIDAPGTSAPTFKTEDGKILKLYPFGDYIAPTGTASRDTFDTATVTTAQLAERVKAIIDDLKQTGLIG